MEAKMDKKKKKNWFKIVMLPLFIAYISLYILNVSGYYDGNIRRKVQFTESQIAEFENDIAEGKNVDIKDYLKDQNIDYTNNVSRFGYKFSSNIDSFFNNSIKQILKLVSILVS